MIEGHSILYIQPLLHLREEESVSSLIGKEVSSFLIIFKMSSSSSLPFSSLMITCMASMNNSNHLYPITHSWTLMNSCKERNEVS